MIKILVAYNDKFPFFKGKDFLPVLAGAAFSEKSQIETLADNAGENISLKNKTYNELTVLYWAYKNYDAIGAPEYIGLCHYARYFIFEQKKYAYYQGKLKDEGISEKIKEENLSEKLFENFDFIAPLPSLRKSVYKNYCSAHHKDDIDLALNIIEEKFPKIFPSAKKYVSGKAAFFYNMFILKKEDFFAYSDFIFSVLEEYEKKTAHKNERFFISEVLSGIFFTYLIGIGKKPLFLPILHFYKKPTFKQALKECKSNFKDKKSGFLFKIKPILIFFIPNFILNIRKRRTIKGQTI